MSRRRKIVLTEVQVEALLKLAASGLLPLADLITLARALSTNGIGIPGIVPGNLPPDLPPRPVSAGEVPPWRLAPPALPTSEVGAERATPSRARPSVRRGARR